MHNTLGSPIALKIVRTVATEIQQQRISQIGSQGIPAGAPRYLKATRRHSYLVGEVPEKGRAARVLAPPRVICQHPHPWEASLLSYVSYLAYCH